MKKILAALSIVMVFAIASPAMAKGVKVPTLLCFEWPRHMQLSLKSTGNVIGPGGKVKMYTIAGTVLFNEDDDRPITGSGYVSPGTTTLRAFLTTGYSWSITRYELTWDLETKTGNFYKVSQYDASSEVEEGYGVMRESTDCTWLRVEE